MSTKGKIDTMYKAQLNLILILLLPNFLFGQLSLFQWNSHLSFSQINLVDGSVTKILAATDGGIFVYNRADNSIETVSSVNGLSDSGITAIKWSDSSKSLLVGYSNGNVDFIGNDGTFNLPFIKQEIGISDKRINQIFEDGKFAWLCCGFGIVKVNLEKKEIAETWIIGPDGTPVEVLDFSMGPDYFVAATSKGLFRADKDNPNLQDYSQWEQINDIPGYSDKFISVAYFNNSLYALNSNTEQIHMWNGSFWQSVLSDINDVKKIVNGSNELLIISENSIDIITKNGRTTITNYGPGINQILPTDAFTGTDGDIWIGDKQLSLYHRFGNGSFEQIMPNGPANSYATNITSLNGKLYVATGRKTGTGIIPQGIHIYSENRWQSVVTSPSPGFNGTNNLIKVVPDPANPDKYYAASWENGFFSFDNDILKTRSDQTNSPLEATGNSCRIGGLAFDNDNNLWVTNPNSEHQVHYINPSGQWYSFSYPGINNTLTSSGEIVISRRGSKWIIVNESELFAIHSGTDLEDKNDDQYKRFGLQSIFSNMDNTITKRYSKILSIAEDNNGELWFGTNEGVVVFQKPEQVFEEDSYYGTQPGTDLGDGLYHPLLEKEEVTAIAIDGSNRKWFGTFDSGAFLFSENGDKLISHFNTENSPLPSNTVKSIGIDHKNGEVFFATGGGLISYKSDATEGNNSFDGVYVYPNPVREIFKGEITIDGLMSETIVKITDIAGNLVFETTSNGGRATWDGNDSGGRRVNTGGVPRVLFNPYRRTIICHKTTVYQII